MRRRNAVAICGNGVETVFHGCDPTINIHDGATATLWVEHEGGLVQIEVRSNGGHAEVFTRCPSIVRSFDSWTTKREIKLGEGE